MKPSIVQWLEWFKKRRKATVSDEPTRVPYTYHATVVRVIDGDTLEVMLDLGFNVLRREHLRLIGINTPELRDKDPAERARAQDAKAALVELVEREGGHIVVKTSRDSQGKFGRFLAEVWVGEINANEALVARGLAERMP